MFYQHCVKTSTSIIFAIEPDGGISYLNPHGLQALGYCATEVIKRQLIDILHEHSVASCRALIRQLKEGMSFGNVALVFLTKDGEQLLAAGSFVPMMQSGHMLYATGVFHDSTARERLLRKLQRAMAYERKRAKFQEQLFRVLTHELGTPLSTILMLSGLLKRKMGQAVKDKLGKHVQDIEYQVDHLNILLKTFAEFSASDTQGLQLDPVSLDLEQFCRQIVSEVGLIARPNQQLIFYSSSEAILAVVDTRLLRQILTNLLTNAIKYSPDDRAIQLHLIYEKDTIVFHVVDEGIGIPENDLDRLFDYGFRAANVDDTPGTGLGLAVVKYAVDVHAGNISVESQVGSGTTFTVRLPLTPDHKPGGLRGQSHIAAV